MPRFSENQFLNAVQAVTGASTEKNTGPAQNAGEAMVQRIQNDPANQAKADYYSGGESGGDSGSGLVLGQWEPDSSRPGVLRRQLVNRGDRQLTTRGGQNSLLTGLTGRQNTPLTALTGERNQGTGISQAAASAANESGKPMFSLTGTQNAEDAVTSLDKYRALQQKVNELNSQDKTYWSDMDWITFELAKADTQRARVGESISASSEALIRETNKTGTKEESREQERTSEQAGKSRPAGDTSLDRYQALQQKVNELDSQDKTYWSDMDWITFELAKADAERARVGESISESSLRLIGETGKKKLPSRITHSSATSTVKKDNAARGTSRIIGDIYDNADGRESSLYSSEYAKILQRPDYQENAAAGESKLRIFGSDLRYDYINDINGARERADIEIAAGNGDKSLPKYAFMTRDEIGVYNYLYATQGKKAANAFLKKLDPELNAQWYSGATRFTQEQANRNVGTKALYSAATVAAQPARGITSGLALGQDVLNMIRGKEIDPNSELRQMSNLTGDIRGSIAEDMGQVGSFVYQTGMSAGDSAINFMTALGVGQALGLTGDALMKTTNVLGSAAMSSEVASNSVVESKQKGYSDIGAFSLAMLRGGFEYLTEAIGGDWVIKNVKKNPLNVLKAMVLGMVPEGTEEVMSDAANEGANLIIDKVFGTQESYIGQSWRYYKEQGEEHPLLMTMKTVLQEELKSFAGGAFATIGSSGVQSYANRQAINESAERLHTSPETVVQLMEEVDTDNPQAISWLAELHDANTVKEFRERVSAAKAAAEAIDKMMQHPERMDAAEEGLKLGEDEAQEESAEKEQAVRPAEKEAGEDTEEATEEAGEERYFVDEHGNVVVNGDITTDKVRTILQDIYEGKNKKTGFTFPVLKHTPQVFMDYCHLDGDRSFVMWSGKAYQAMQSNVKSQHALGVDGMMKVIRQLHTPDYIVYQNVGQNAGHYVAIVTIDNGETVAAVDLGEYRRGNGTVNEEDGYYNVLITAFSPDSDYIDNNILIPENDVVYDRSVDKQYEAPEEVYLSDSLSRLPTGTSSEAPEDVGLSESRSGLAPGASEGSITEGRGNGKLKLEGENHGTQNNQQGTAQAEPGLSEPAQAQQTQGEDGLRLGEADEIRTAGGTEPAAAAGGTDAADRGRGRLDDGRTGGEAGRVVRDAGTGRGEPGADREGRNAAGQSLGDAVRRSGAEELSAKEFGLRTGTDRKTFRVVPEEMLTDELLELRYSIRNQTGCSVDFIAGYMEVTGDDGSAHKVSGYYDRSGSRIVVRVDSRRYTAEQIGKHEVFHALAKTDPGLVAEIRYRVLRRYGRDDLQRILNTYIIRRRGLTRIESGSVTDEAALELLEEVFADANGNMNAFEAGADRYAYEVWSGIYDRKNSQIESGSSQTRGPPPARTWEEKRYGERYSYAGEEAGTADLDALQRAKEMEEQDVDKETIRRETGWFRGMDNKWRFEIDDSEAKYSRTGDVEFRKDHPEYAEFRDLLSRFGELSEEEMARVQELHATWNDEIGRLARRLENGSVPLNQVLDHPALFRAYPELKEVRVQIREIGSDVQGGYSAVTNTITINKDARDKLSTLLHETQHAIQEIEGFTGGASTEYWTERNAREQPELDSRMEELRNSAQSLRRELDRQEELTGYNDFIEDTYQLADAGEITEEEADRRIKQFETEHAGLRSLNAALEDIYHEMGEIRGKMRTADDLYRNTAGEIEARDTEKRRFYSTEERRQKAPDLGDENTVFADKSAMRLNADEDPEILHLKEQLKAAKDLLDSMDPVTNIQAPTKYPKRQSDKVAWAEEALKVYGKIISIPEFGNVNLGNRIERGMKYARTDADRAAFLAIPAVLKRGKIIAHHAQHKGGKVKADQDIESWTFGAPVMINGVTGHMGVIVQKTTGLFYKAHKVLMPDGSAFLLTEIEEAEPGRVQGAVKDDRLVAPTGSATGNNVTQSQEISKENFSISEEDEDYQFTLDDVSGGEMYKSGLHPDMRSRLESTEDLTQAVKDYFRDVDPENEAWLSGEDIDALMELNLYQSDGTRGDIHGADEILQNLSELSEDQAGSARRETWQLMERILPHTDTFTQSLWTGTNRDGDTRDPHFARWYNNRHPSLYYPGYKPGDLFMSSKEETEWGDTFQEGNIEKEREYLRDLLDSGKLMEPELTDARELLRQLENPEEGRVFYSVDEDEDLANQGGADYNAVTDPRTRRAIELIRQGAIGGRIYDETGLMRINGGLRNPETGEIIWRDDNGSIGNTEEGSTRRQTQRSAKARIPEYDRRGVSGRSGEESYARQWRTLTRRERRIVTDLISQYTKQNSTYELRLLRSEYQSEEAFAKDIYDRYSRGEEIYAGDDLTELIPNIHELVAQLDEALGIESGDLYSVEEDELDTIREERDRLEAQMGRLEPQPDGSYRDSETGEIFSMKEASDLAERYMELDNQVEQMRSTQTGGELKVGEAESGRITEETGTEQQTELQPEDPKDRTIRELRAMNRELEKYAEYWKKQGRITGEGEEKAKRRDVQRVVRELMEHAGYQGDRSALQQKIQTLADTVISNNRGDGLVWEDLREQAAEIAEELVDGSYTILDPEGDLRQSLKARLKELKIRPDKMWTDDVGDWSSFRKQQIGTLVFSRDGQGIDTVYQTLNGEFGEGLFPSDITAGSDQVNRILTALDSLQAQREFNFANDQDAELAEQYYTNRILDEVLYGQVGEELTRADRNYRRVKERLQKAEREVREIRKESRNQIMELQRNQHQEVKGALLKQRENMAQREKIRKVRKKIDQTGKRLVKYMAENDGKNPIPEPLKEAVGRVLLDLDLSGGMEKSQKKRYVRNMQEIARIVARQNSYLQGETDQWAGMYLDLPSDTVEALNEHLDNVQKAMDEAEARGRIWNPNMMNLEELERLDEILTVLSSAIKNSNEILSDARGAKVSEEAGAGIRYMKSLGTDRERSTNGEKINRFLRFQNTTPYYFFRKLGEPGMKMFERIQDGWDKFAFNAKQVVDFAEETYTAKEAKEIQESVYTFKLRRRGDLTEGFDKPETVTMTKAQIMSLYCLWKREQARGHLAGAGIRIADYQDGKRTVKQAENYLLDLEDIDRILSVLTKRDKEIADKLQHYMNTVGSDWGNEVSMKRFGIRSFTEENYFPIQTDDRSRQLRNPESDTANLYRLLNMSFTKNVTRNASNSIVLDNIFDVFANHMADMAKYNGLGLPMLDAMKWFSYQQTGDLNEEGQYGYDSIQKQAEIAFGKEARNYFTTFMQDLNGVREGGRGEEFGSRMLSSYKVAAVGANLRVALLQPTSYLRASAVLDKKYLVKGLQRNNKQGQQEAIEWSGTAVWKDLGFYDTNINAGLREMIKHTDGAKEKIQELSMKGAEIGDKVTWGALWNACRAEQEDKGLSGDELMEATAKRFREVIYRTQVMDSTMTRSHVMRQKGAYAGMVTAFMSEPTLSYNMLLDAYSEYENEVRKNMAGKDPKDRKAKAEAKEKAWKKNRDTIGKTAAAYLATAVLSAIAESAIDAARDDDEYATYLERFTTALLGLNPADKDAGVWAQIKAIPNGNLMEDLLVHNKLPVIKDFFGLLGGQSSSRMDTEWMANIIKAGQIWAETIALQMGWKEKPTKVTYNGNMTTWGKVYNTLRAVSQIVGLPLGNGVRDAVALWNTTAGEANPQLKVQTYDPGEEKKIQYAVADGYLTEEEAIDLLMKYELADDEIDAQQMAYTWAHPERYERLLSAMNAGDQEEFEAAQEELGDLRFKPSSIATAVKGEIEARYLGHDRDGNAVADPVDRQTAVEMLMKYGGMIERKAEELVQQWSCELETGIPYSGISDAYVAGDISKMQAEGMLVQYGGYAEEKAAAQVQKWSSSVDTGIGYSEIGDRFFYGEITQDEAVEMYMKYGGKSKEDAEDTVLGIAFRRDTGHERERVELQTMYIEGEYSRDEMKRMMLEYRYSKTPESAENSLIRWDFIGTDMSLDDVSPWQAKRYFDELEAADIDKKTYLEFVQQAETMKGEVDENGKSIPYSKMDKIFALIDSLDLTPEQKDALALAGWDSSNDGYSEKNLSRAPWHDGESSTSKSKKKSSGRRSYGGRRGGGRRRGGGGGLTLGATFAEPDNGHSGMFNQILRMWKRKKYSRAQILALVRIGKLTKAEADEILATAQEIDTPAGTGETAAGTEGTEVGELPGDGGLMLGAAEEEKKSA